MNENPKLDIASQFQDFIGKSISIEDEISLSAVRHMAAMLNLDPAVFYTGSEIPPHWYSMFFTLNAQQSQLGHDGHPKRGEFLPPIPLPRRMFVGRRVSFPGALRVGDHASKKSEITSIKQKEGSSGALVFVVVKHTIEVGDRPVIIEEQEIVYREAAIEKGEKQPAKSSPAPEGNVWVNSITMDPVLVFRYSALTWNSHRIHYDADYARQQEGYPACVMNGALTVHLLVEEALKQNPEKKLIGLGAKLIKPLFVGGELFLKGAAYNAGNVNAWATDETGALAAMVELHFREK